jgi:hypothetical protein
MTGTPQGLGLYDVNYTGNSKTTTSELLGAGVNHVTNLLTAGQTLTLGGEAIINGNLVNASGILDTANNPVTLNGSFTNLSTFNAGSSAITIGGSSIAPTIAGFTTTGPLNFTRSASTAAFTGQVTAGALTINGSGGTLDLAAGFSHQFNGDVTFTNGTLNANASDIGLTGNWANNGGSFLAGTGTVTFNGTAPQIISGNVTAFENLTINPGAIVTVPATNSPTVANTVVNNGGLRQSAVIGVGGTHQFLNLQTGGGATRYRGIDFTSTAGDPGTVTVLVRGNQDACDGYNFIIHRCYTLDLTGSPTATLTFYYENSELNGSACAIMQAYHWNGNTWDTALTLDPTFYDDGRQCTGEGTADGTAANPWALQVTNVSSFSPFGVTSGGSPTAIRLKDLSGSSANPGPTLLFVSLFALMGGAVVWVLRRK